ncbi:NADH-quinone oxidoreductase subunit C, partial [Streptomyces sp. NPDC059101]
MSDPATPRPATGRPPAGPRPPRRPRTTALLAAALAAVTALPACAAPAASAHPARARAGAPPPLRGWRAVGDRTPRTHKNAPP